MEQTHWPQGSEHRQFCAITNDIVRRPEESMGVGNNVHGLLHPLNRPLSNPIVQARADEADPAWLGAGLGRA